MAQCRRHFDVLGGVATLESGDAGQWIVRGGIGWCCATHVEPVEAAIACPADGLPDDERAGSDAAVDSLRSRMRINGMVALGGYPGEGNEVVGWLA